MMDYETWWYERRIGREPEIVATLSVIVRGPEPPTALTEDVRFAIAEDLADLLGDEYEVEVKEGNA